MIGLMLILSAILILVNAAFVIVEIAIIRVRPSAVESLARQGSRRALHAQDILKNLDVYLAAIQIGVTGCSLALGSIGEPAIAKVLSGGLRRLPWDLPAETVHVLSFGTALILLTFVTIVFGELIPRGISIQFSERIALWGAMPLKALNAVARIPVVIMSGVSVALLRLFGFKPAAESDAIVSEDEMRILLGESQEKGKLPFERLMLLENLFDFGTAKVMEAMVPIGRAATLSLSKSWEENLAVIRERRHSRYILCEQGIESIVGMVHVKDILLRTGPGHLPDLRSLRRNLHEVRDTDPMEKLIKVFPDKGIHIALVRDVNGRAVGILTLEDIMEELVGEVHDEHDLPEAWTLTAVVPSSAVAVRLEAPDRQSAIAQLLEKLGQAVPEFDHKETLRIICERELKFSSGIGRGVAVPHARLASLTKPLVALGRFFKPVPFPSPDNVPVRLVFLILTPSSTPILQLKILQRIVSLVTNDNLRRKLLRAKSAESLLEALRTADTMLAE